MAVGIKKESRLWVKKMRTDDREPTANGRAWFGHGRSCDLCEPCAVYFVVGASYWRPAGIGQADRANPWPESTLVVARPQPR